MENRKERHLRSKQAVEYLKNIDPKNEYQQDSMLFLAAQSDDGDAYEQSVLFKGGQYNLAQNILAMLQNKTTPDIVKKSILSAVAQFIGHDAKDEKEYKLGKKINNYTVEKYGEIECNCPDCKARKAGKKGIDTEDILKDIFGKVRPVND